MKLGVKLITNKCISFFTQGVEGIRGRQGLEGPKGDDVSSTIVNTLLKCIAKHN